MNRIFFFNHIIILPDINILSISALTDILNLFTLLFFSNMVIYRCQILLPVVDKMKELDKCYTMHEFHFVFMFSIKHIILMFFCLVSINISRPRLREASIYDSNNL